MMKVKIIKCSGEHWYKNDIGKEFIFNKIRISFYGNVLVNDFQFQKPLGIFMKDSNLRITCKLEKI